MRDWTVLWLGIAFWIVCGCVFVGGLLGWVLN
jgi:hypothetical protein